MRIPIDDLDDEAIKRLSGIASLRKYNADWEDEPRVPAGNPDGGQWTAEDGADADGGPAPIGVDFSEGFHDEVVDAWVKSFNEHGIPAVKSPGLRMLGGDGSIVGYPDILIRAPGLPVEAIEVKAGAAPTFTPNQVLVHPDVTDR